MKERDEVVSPPDSAPCGREIKAGGTTSKGRSAFIRTFGCQMNNYDSELVAGILTRKGYVITDDEGEADVALFVTCSVRQHAEERVWGKVGMLKKWKEESSKDFIRSTEYGIRNTRIIGILGCMAQYYGAEIFTRLPHVNIVCGTGHIDEIDRLLERAFAGEKILAVDRLERRPMSEERKSRIVYLQKEKKPVTAFVTIMEGCSNYCSYCVVPYLRGEERSRPSPEILEEIKGLAEKGVKEITLLGQNVNSYGKTLDEEINFVGLLEEIERLGVLKRLRFTTSHPRDATIELFQAMRKLEVVCEHLHLPVQSGSHKILDLMNRKYDPLDYLVLVNKLRAIVPGVAITTDIIVGHPGESEADFRQTVELMKEVCFDGAYIFKYSQRPGTASARMEDDVPREVKGERLQVLLKLQEETSRKINQGLIGEEFEVLVEGESKKPIVAACVCGGRGGLGESAEDACFQGRTRSNKNVLFTGKGVRAGELVKVKIVHATPHTLIGEVVR